MFLLKDYIDWLLGLRLWFDCQLKALFFCMVESLISSLEWSWIFLQVGAGTSKKNRSTTGNSCFDSIKSLSWYACLIFLGNSCDLGDGLNFYCFGSCTYIHISRAANSNALKLSCEYIRVFITGSCIRDLLDSLVDQCCQFEVFLM